MKANQNFELQEKLRYYYIEKEMSIPTISLILKVPKFTLYELLKKLNIPSRKSSFYIIGKKLSKETIEKLKIQREKSKIVIDKEWLYEKYHNQQLNSTQIAKLLECSNTTVLFNLRLNNFKVRSLSECKKGKLNPQYDIGSKHYLYGKTRGRETVEKIKLKLPRGELHFRYKKPEDRIENLNNQIRNCQKSKEWKFFILKRDNFTCQLCFKKRSNIVKIHVDHIKPFSQIKTENNINSLEEAINCSELWDTNNGRVLCVECHKNTETYGYKKQK